MLTESIDLGRSDGMVERRLRLASSSPDVKALFNSPSYIYNLETHDDSQASYMSGSSQDYWTPLAPIVSPQHAVRTCQQANIFQGSGLTNRTRHTDDALKRGSDSLLEAKLKEQISKPRSLNNRAQSLDLTYSLSRITESPSYLPPPESPTNSTGDTGGDSSPTSASAPSFPSVYGSRGTVVGSSAQRTGHILDDETIQEVSRVISNLGL